MALTTKQKRFLLSSHDTDDLADRVLRLTKELSYKEQRNIYKYQAIAQSIVDSVFVSKLKTPYKALVQYCYKKGFRYKEPHIEVTDGIAFVTTNHIAVKFDTAIACEDVLLDGTYKFDHITRRIWKQEVGERFPSVDHLFEYNYDTVVTYDKSDAGIDIYKSEDGTVVLPISVDTTKLFDKLTVVFKCSSTLFNIGLYTTVFNNNTPIEFTGEGITGFFMSADKRFLNEHTSD